MDLRRALGELRDGGGLTEFCALFYRENVLLLLLNALPQVPFEARKALIGIISFFVQRTITGATAQGGERVPITDYVVR